VEADLKIAVEADPDNAVMGELADETQIIPELHELPSDHIHFHELPGSDPQPSSEGEK
jgi:hypothetical protein